MIDRGLRHDAAGLATIRPAGVSPFDVVAWALPAPLFVYEGPDRRRHSFRIGPFTNSGSRS